MTEFTFLGLTIPLTSIRKFINKNNKNNENNLCTWVHDSTCLVFNVIMLDLDQRLRHHALASCTVMNAHPQEKQERRKCGIKSSFFLGAKTIRGFINSWTSLPISLLRFWTWEHLCCVAVYGGSESSLFSSNKNILICVPTMNGGLAGLERHQGEYLMTSFSFLGRMLLIK